MNQPTGFLELLNEEITAAAQAAAANDQLGWTDLAESWRRRVDHLLVYRESARLQQTEPSPGLG